MEKKCCMCGSEEETKRCGTCHNVFYCSDECQKKNWKIHKKTCKKTYKGLFVGYDNVENCYIYKTYELLNNKKQDFISFDIFGDKLRIYPQEKPDNFDNILGIWMNLFCLDENKEEKIEKILRGKLIVFDENKDFNHHNFNKFILRFAEK